jgi:cell division protein FtsI/penicillin-binding protein 2
MKNNRKNKSRKIESNFSDRYSKRITAYAVICVVFALCVVGRLYQLTVLKHQMYIALASDQRSRDQQLTATRGDILISDIYSPQPYPVATNVQKNMVYVVPASVLNLTQTSQQLATILGLDQSDIYNSITAGQNYVPIMHGLSDQQSQEIQQANLSGVFLSPEGTRVYPEGTLLSSVIGFISYTSNSGDEKVGRYGLEKYFQKQLAGTDGSLTTSSSTGGVTGGINGILTGGELFTPPTDGSNLLLTVDRSIQNEAETVLKETVQQHGADSGSAIVADPKTGKILAMAGFPDYDPNNFNTVTDQSVFNNAPTTENFEPGSTFKAITLSSALDAGVITPQTTYDNTDNVQIDGATIKNAEATNIGQTTMTQVIDHSLNTGAIFVENKLGNDQFAQYLNKFGFGQPTNIELPENVGDLSNLSSGSPQVDFDTASFGQGITVTPIQMVQAYMAMANGGVMMQPYIVDSIIHPDGTVDQTQPKVAGKPISPEAASQITAMLVDDIENGYGEQAAVKGYYLGGKTGTAQVAVNGKYLPNDNIGSFIGYGPANDPKFVIAVIINNPKDVEFAETTAAPAFHDIASFILNYYQIPPTRK